MNDRNIKQITIYSRNVSKIIIMIQNWNDMEYREFKLEIDVATEMNDHERRMSFNVVMSRFCLPKYDLETL